MKYIVFIILLFLLSCSGQEKKEIDAVKDKAIAQGSASVELSDKSSSKIPGSLTDMISRYKLDINDKDVESKIRKYEERRTLVQDEMLINKDGVEAIDSIKAKYGEPTRIERKERVNDYDKKQIDEIETWFYKGIRYGIYKMNKEYDHCLIVSCVIDKDIEKSTYRPLFDMTIEQLIEYYGDCTMSEPDSFFLSPVDPNICIEYGIFGIFKEGKLDHIEFTLLV